MPSWLRAAAAVATLATVAAAREPLRVEVEIDGRTRELVAMPGEHPRTAARFFCAEHNLTLSVEGMGCEEMLAEELIDQGARYPLPLEAVLRARPDDDASASAAAACAGWGVDACDALTDAAVGLLGGAAKIFRGEVVAPLDVAERRLRPPMLSIDLDVPWANAPLPFREWDRHLSEEASNLLAEPAAHPDASMPHGRAAAAFCAAWRCPDRVFEARRVAAAVSARSGAAAAALETKPTRLVCSMSTLPGRVKHLPRQLGFLYAQTRRPDAIYVAIPRRSVRAQAEYVVRRPRAGS